MDYPVLITKKINFPLTYKSGALGKLKVGDIVTVPFGKSEEIGVIWDKKQITKKMKQNKCNLKPSSFTTITPHPFKYTRFFPGIKH